MRVIPVALALFHRKTAEGLEVWTQFREDEGPYHGLQEFPGGGIEMNETPLQAVVREVEEEVGIRVDASLGRLMGIYINDFPGKSILLNVFLFPDHPELLNRGQWLLITKEMGSAPYQGLIPGPNHRMIDDLFRSLYDGAHE